MTEYSPDRCPICGQPNLCAIEIARASGEVPAPCWCAQTSFSAELLNRIPPDARGVACLCPSCVKASQE
ncbi:MAG: cysteine-rich CWC family protein [Rhodoferax sp.]|uniref:cysteine-rich CWC family protein n=1 Tax=Rhodoferax sp. TaxID=50421 RepID=UPI001B41712A|nr:cysteine-rich CWC family protein [Rhodoferax sp.]MBP9737840.1 cysteine-rich CWC family protein [Rhodoferax sp.]